jgi:diguanylate cyclase (GGDEF)-like protein
MKIALDRLHTAVWIFDIDRLCMIWANQAALKLWDSPSLEELLQRDFKSDVSAAVKESMHQFQHAFRNNEVIQESWQFSPKGQVAQAFCQFSGFPLENNSMAMLVEAIPTNVLHSDLQLGSTVLISIYSEKGDFLSGNPPFIPEFGHQVKHLKQLFCNPDVLTNLYQSIVKGQRFEQDVLMRTKSGETWYRLFATKSINEQGEVTILLHQYNIHERKSIEQTLREQAWTDPLTVLLNRRGLTHALTQSIDNNIPFTLLYIDLDGFKMVNDSLGHGKGDLILKEVANRLRQHKYPSGQLCRFGGDEFVFAIHNDDINDQINVFSEHLIKQISEPYENIKGSSLSLSASIGISCFPEDGDEIEHLITCADAAMYQAKKLGKKRAVNYINGMEKVHKRASSIAYELSSAIQNDELELFYQPIFNIKAGTIHSFEALLRWTNAELGQVSPQETILVAEQTGLIHDIESWVLNQALSDLAKLRSVTEKSATMAVNISGLHMAQPKLLEIIISMLDVHGLQPVDLTIELTESVLLSDIDKEQNPTQQITSNGIKLNIDDFGTGYSSLAYLHAIPASVVKVDRSFLAQADDNTVTLECIHTLVNSLNMQSLIEGIETEHQSQLLASLGYNLQQGYLLGRPQPIAYYFTEKFSYSKA